MKKLPSTAMFLSAALGAAAASAGSVKVEIPVHEVDLVVSVDTFAAHLAGAIGRPVWTMLSADCDWRWMRDRDDSPWYPTMKLFRQTRHDDWSDVVARVRDAIVTTSERHLHLHAAASHG